MTTELTREQVESLLACADTYRNGPYAPVKPDELRALCRAWLALHDAPVREVDGKTVRLVAVD